MGSWFVRPDTVVLQLSDGETLTVRRRLNAGEEQDLMDRVQGASRARIRRELVVAYLLGWSLVDGDGTHVAIDPGQPEAIVATLRHLDPDRFNEIADVVITYDNDLRTARDEEKKRRAGANASSSTSPSPSASAGATSGSLSSTPMST